MRTLGVRETWYFGLQFVDKKAIVTWIKFNKKVLNGNKEFYFCIRLIENVKNCRNSEATRARPCGIDNVNLMIASARSISCCNPLALKFFSSNIFHTYPHDFF